jgi:3-hydroxyisobutyrate dehydrogenase
MAERTLAVLGTGIMGAPIARNLANAGFEVHAWNRSRRKAESLTGDGVKVAATPAGAIDGAQIVVTMLADGEAVESVMDDAALDAFADDALWIQSSTVGVAAIQRLIDFAAEREIAFVDAPVMGTRKPAEDAALTVLASGPDALHDRCAPVFDAIGSKTVWLGAAGASTRMKVVINGWLLSLTAALGESLALARGLDVDRATFLDILDGAPMGSPYVQVKGKAILANDFTPSFTAHLASKDARLVIEAAEHLGIDLELARTVANLYDRTTALGHGDKDMSAVVKASEL